MEEAVAGDELASLAATVAGLTGTSPKVHDAPAPASLALRAPRVVPPPSLAHLCAADPATRAAHTHGKAFRDVVRNLLGRLDHPPDLVAFPRSEDDLISILEWCAHAGLAVVPYGGGSSVVGGVEPDVGDAFPGAVTVNLTGMDRVLEVDRDSLAVRAQGGVLGPVLEDQLRPLGLTVRHFPQSFEFSTLGGWVATRSGGHFATLYTHIDDLVEALRVVTPSGVVQTRRLPASGAGPAPERLFLGSEGSLGVITEAWVRVVPRPRWRAGASVRFEDFRAGVEAARALAQSRLYPANCRLLDGGEAALSAGSPGLGALLVLAFESADHPPDASLRRALEICASAGGSPGEPRYSDAEREGARDEASGQWRRSFVRAPYTRDALARMGMVVETFETACTWAAFDGLHDAVMAAAREAVTRVCGPGIVTCRFTHVYPDGPAPYFSVMAQGRWGEQVAQWDEVKAAVSEALVAAGGTITHHHAVGRVHRPWYEGEVPALYRAAVAQAKQALDPSGILNPGVLAGP